MPPQKNTPSPPLFFYENRTILLLRLICPSKSVAFTTKTARGCKSETDDPTSRSLFINISSGPCRSKHDILNDGIWFPAFETNHRPGRYEMNKLFGAIQGIRLCLSHSLSQLKHRTIRKPLLRRTTRWAIHPRKPQVSRSLCWTNNTIRNAVAPRVSLSPRFSHARSLARADE